MTECVDVDARLVSIVAFMVLVMIVVIAVNQMSKSEMQVCLDYCNTLPQTDDFEQVIKNSCMTSCIQKLGECENGQ